MASSNNRLADVLERDYDGILQAWVSEQNALPTIRGRLREQELGEQCAGFLRLFRDAVAKGGAAGTSGPEWTTLKSYLTEISRSRATQGFGPSETAVFFSLKRPLYARLRADLGGDAEALADNYWLATELLDKLGLLTTEAFQQGREEVIARQQQDMLELSTPVVELSDGILALPMIGTLDSNRTQIVMETLLDKIVETGAAVAILDITGVPTVDTLVAQHLIKTVTAARLMGADCIISGIRPQIAQTIVHLGVDLGNVTTKATLAAAFMLALQRTGQAIVKTSSRAAGAAPPRE